ncbi:glycosyltransferase family 4 protein [Flavobacterium sp. KBS0721]|uniref:glycosyltransferase family 4 protein n=1 Tax=Flavobacterium sp. KBS0721 TaxID=1179672 RepID=UPI000F4F487E|nr:glycosyltransferase family 4 protein [Flavobacterium sp. KBS0721]QDW20868.1 glycosyltransferase family 4 protein [Flavobacterium sp. KBS0721]
MSSKKNVLMICSWLDYKLRLGSFFMEQALILSNDFNFILINFRPIKFKIKNYRKIFKIEKNTYEDKVTILYLYYPSFKILKNNYFSKVIEKKAFRVLHQYCKKDKIEIDLIHAQSIFDAAFWALSYHEEYKTPYLLTEHNQFTLRNVSKQKIKKIDAVLKKSKFNLVVSDDLVRQFATNYFFGDFINVGNAVDEKIFNNCNRTKSEYFEIITVGAYAPIKNQIKTLRALQIIDNLNYQKIKFTWIGINAWGTDCMEEVNNLVRSFQFKNIQIELVERASKEQIVAALQKSDVFVFTSLCETFGVSPLEALFTGLPVITTQSGGVNEFITKENGIIVPVKDFKAIAENILKILNKELQFDHESISKNAISGFGVKAFREKMIPIYNKSIAS